MASAAAQMEERALVERTLTGIRLPEGVRLLRFDEITDSTGDPGYRFFFEIPKNYSLEDEDIQALSDVRQQVYDRLLPLGLDRWPYIRFLEAA